MNDEGNCVSIDGGARALYWTTCWAMLAMGLIILAYSTLAYCRRANRLIVDYEEEKRKVEGSKSWKKTAIKTQEPEVKGAAKPEGEGAIAMKKEIRLGGHIVSLDFLKMKLPGDGLFADHFTSSMWRNLGSSFVVAGLVFLLLLAMLLLGALLLASMTNWSLNTAMLVLFLNQVGIEEPPCEAMASVGDLTRAGQSFAMFIPSVTYAWSNITIGFMGLLLVFRKVPDRAADTPFWSMFFVLAVAPVIVMGVGALFGFLLAALEDISVQDGPMIGISLVTGSPLLKPIEDARMTKPFSILLFLLVRCWMLCFSSVVVRLVLFHPFFHWMLCIMEGEPDKDDLISVVWPAELTSILPESQGAFADLANCFEASEGARRESPRKKAVQPCHSRAKIKAKLANMAEEHKALRETSKKVRQQFQDQAEQVKKLREAFETSEGQVEELERTREEQDKHLAAVEKELEDTQRALKDSKAAHYEDHRQMLFWERSYATYKQAVIGEDLASDQINIVLDSVDLPPDRGSDCECCNTGCRRTKALEDTVRILQRDAHRGRRGPSPREEWDPHPPQPLAAQEELGMFSRETQHAPTNIGGAIEGRSSSDSVVADSQPHSPRLMAASSLMERLRATEDRARAAEAELRAIGSRAPPPQEQQHAEEEAPHVKPTRGAFGPKLRFRNPDATPVTIMHLVDGRTVQPESPLSPAVGAEGGSRNIQATGGGKCYLI